MAKKKEEKNLKASKLPKSKIGRTPKEPRTVIPEPQTMEELLSSTGYQLRGLKRGDLIVGTIVSVTPSEIAIDIGYKRLGIVSEREMELARDLLRELKVGDKITVQVIFPETDAGQTILSVRRAGVEKKWQELIDKKEKEELTEVVGLEMTRGGVLVNWQGLRGFVPASQLDPARMGNLQSSLGETLKVIILEVDRTTNRLVFSEKKAVLPQKLADKTQALAKIKIGKTYEGQVTGLVPFGIFVSIEGLEGLVHISEIAWERIADLKKRFKINDKVQASLMGIDEKSGKLNLSIRNLLTNPWEEIAQKYPVDTTTKGKVVKVTQYGLLVSLEGGKNVPEATGMLHISKIPAGLEAKEGETIQVTVESVDTTKRRINLGLVLKEKPMGYK